MSHIHWPEVCQQCSSSHFGNVYLDQQWNITLSVKHSVDNHSSNFTRDDILRNPEANLLIGTIWQKTQQIMIYTIKIVSMLPRIIQTRSSYLRELASTQKSSWDERIRR